MIFLCEHETSPIRRVHGTKKKTVELKILTVTWNQEGAKCCQLHTIFFSINFNQIPYSFLIELFWKDRHSKRWRRHTKLIHSPHYMFWNVFVFFVWKWHWFNDNYQRRNISLHKNQWSVQQSRAPKTEHRKWSKIGYFVFCSFFFFVFWNVHSLGDGPIEPAVELNLLVVVLAVSLTSCFCLIPWNYTRVFETLFFVFFL